MAIADFKSQLIVTSKLNSLFTLPHRLIKTMDVTAIYPPLTKNNIYAVLVLTSALFSRYHSSSSNTNEAIFRKTEGKKPDLNMVSCRNMQLFQKKLSKSIIDIGTERNCVV